MKIKIAVLALAILSPLAVSLIIPGLTQADSTLVGYWKFDEGTGTTSVDYSSLENDASFLHEAGFSNTQTAPTNFSNPYSLLLDGVNDYVHVDHSGSLDLSSSMTAMAWVYWNGSNGNTDDNVILDKSDGDTPNYRLFIKDNGHVAIWNGTNDGESTGTVPEGQWTLVNFTISDGTTKFYINGELSGTTSVGLGPTNTSELTIGRDTQGRFFNGYIDEVRLYNVALSAEEVSAIADGDQGPANNPDTTITVGPLGFSHNQTEDFEFESNEQPSTFECKLDDGAYSTCTSPYTTASLSEGSHTFSVRAINGFDVIDDSPATVSWTYQAGSGAFEISSCPQLQNIQDNLSASYVLVNDVHCEGSNGTVVYTEDFSNGQGDWTTFGEDDYTSWTVTDQTCELDENVQSPVDLGSAMLGTAGNAGSDCSSEVYENSYVISPEIELPDAENLKLKFLSSAMDEAGSCENDEYDNKTVYVTTDGGDTRTLLNDCQALNAENDVLDQRYWEFDLSEWRDQNIQLIFAYDTDDDCCEFELGWYLDDIEISESTVSNFQPIGTSEDPFTGSFDGDSYSITGLSIFNDIENAGLFGSISSDGLVKNLDLSGFYISNTGDYTGLVAGENYGTIRDITSSEGYVIGGDDSIGGIVGENYGSVFNASTNASIIGDYNVGGIAGYNDGDSTVSYSRSSGTITANGDAGGIVGESDGLVTLNHSDITVISDYIDSRTLGGIVGDNNGEVSDNYSSSLVAGFREIGGIVGYSGGEVSRNYSSGPLLGSESTGGIVGNTGGVTLNYNFSVSEIDGGINSGGILGYQDSDEGSLIFTGNRYDASRSGQDYCFNDGAVENNEDCDAVNEDGNDLDYFKNNNVNIPLNQWDFDNAWGANEDLNNGYPCLLWEEDCGEPEIFNTTSTDISAATDGSKIRLSETGCSIIDNATSSKESSLVVQDSAFDYPLGLINFTLTGCESGGTVNINLTFTGSYNLNGIVIRKYDSVNKTYTTLTNANSGLNLSSTTLNGKAAVMVSYHLVDGGIFDQDGTANGEIVDPLGLAINAVNAPNTGFGGSY